MLHMTACALWLAVLVVLGMAQPQASQPESVEQPAQDEEEAVDTLLDERSHKLHNQNLLSSLLRTKRRPWTLCWTSFERASTVSQ